MKLEGRLTILGNDKGITIEVEDYDSNITFLTIELTTEEFCQAALGRLASMRCELNVNGLEHVGKHMELDTLEFEMPSNMLNVYEPKVLRATAIERANEICPAGWVPDTYFGSQGSFSRKGGKLFAKTTIRRWV